MTADGSASREKRSLTRAAKLAQAGAGDEGKAMRRVVSLRESLSSMEVDDDMVVVSVARKKQRAIR